MFKKTFWLMQAAARYVSAAILNRYLKLIDAERFFFTQADVDAQAEQTTACSKPSVTKNSYASNPTPARTSASSTPPCSPPPGWRRLIDLLPAKQSLLRRQQPGCWHPS